MNMQKPPTWELTEAVHTTAIAPLHIPIASGTSSIIPHSGMFGPHNFGPHHIVIANSHTIDATKKSLEQEYQTRISQLPQTIEQELAATRLEGPTHPLPPADAIIRELGVRNILLSRKTADFHQKTALANQFYGGDPLNRSLIEFYQTASAMGQRVMPGGIAMQAWTASYRAAHEAWLLAQSIQLLNQQQVQVLNWLATVQANDQAQAAAAEAQRIAAERARIAAEQQRQRDVADAAHRDRVAFFARERSRFVALHEARRPAKEQAQTAAEAAAREVAAEQARLEAQAEPLRRAAEAEAEKLRIERAHRTQKEQRERQRENALRTEQDVYRQQAEKNRRERLFQAELEAQEKRRQQALLDAQAEPERLAEQARLKARWQAETEARWENPEFAHYGSVAAFGPTFTGTLGTVGVSPATSLALRTALRAAVSAAIAALASIAAPVLVGFAALAVPSRLGNGDLFSVSVPLSELAPDPTADLYELAAVGGGIDLPVRLGSRAIGNSVEIVVVATDGVIVPASVPVRLARFDARKNVYVSGSTVSNGPVITWTPLVKPQDPSTEFPLIDTHLPIYEGATVTPDAGRIDPFPELDRYGFGGFITVFPIDSGIPPTFTMFRDRRQDPGIATGTGQSVSGNWVGAASTLEGAPIPKQIADKLRGREFSSFRAFRRAFWKAVANDQVLIDQFTLFNKFDIRNGLSPIAHPSEQVGGKKKLEIHHVKPISEGGSVYDIDNLRVLTPKQHTETHSKRGKTSNEF
jgi:hypothetical protein